MNMIVRAAGLAAVLAFVQTAAEAAPPIVIEGTPISTVISYADLDLGSAAGRARLDGRVRRAAESLCVDPGYRSLSERIEGKTCVKLALAGARDQIEQAVVLAGRSPLSGRKTIVVAAR